MFMRTLFKSVYSLKEKNSVICINTAYKWKADKIQSVNLKKTTDETSDELANWQEVL